MPQAQLTKPNKSARKAGKTSSSAPSQKGNASGLPAFMQNPLFHLASGGVLGLSCPGFEQWYLAWFGLVPLFLSIFSTRSIFKLAGTGFCFGLGYSLVYLHWYLNLAPLDWMGFPGLTGLGLSVLAWLLVSGQQALLFGIFAVIVGKMPFCAGFTPKQSESQENSKSKWQLPMLSVVPLIYVLVMNKIGNSPDLLGVPWPMIEYSQYRQNMLIQGASVFGGIGLAYLIVTANLALASLLANFIKPLAVEKLFAENKDTAYYYCLGTILLLGAYIIPGLVEGSNLKTNRPLKVAVLEGSINIDMQKSATGGKIELPEIIERYKLLFKTAGKDCENALTVLPEGALPVYIQESPTTMEWLKKEALERKTDILAGAMDRPAVGHPYNAAFGVTSSGLKAEIYHKRFLVPLGEYTPLFVQYMPEWVRRWTNTPSGSGFMAGKQAGLISLNSVKAGPLICFECISPELTAATCREGAQLLVNISDLAWFHQSDCGRQMLAFSVFRAIENRRSLIFAANTGPSALIDPRGTIAEYKQQNESKVVCGEVQLNSRLTPFALWYR